MFKWIFKKLFGKKPVEHVVFEYDEKKRPYSNYDKRKVDEVTDPVMHNLLMSVLENGVQSGTIKYNDDGTANEFTVDPASDPDNTINKPGDREYGGI